MKAVFKAIRTILLAITLTVIFTFVAGWGCSIASCEYLTSRYGEEFEDLYKENNMIGDELVQFKIIAYYDDYAEVYYVTRIKGTNFEGGDVLTFRKEKGKWVYDGWPRTVWSNYGNADEYIWPYGR